MCHVVPVGLGIVGLALMVAATLALMALIAFVCERIGSSDWYTDWQEKRDRNRYAPRSNAYHFIVKILKWIGWGVVGLFMLFLLSGIVYGMGLDIAAMFFDCSNF
jgi:hypothetical protein